MGLTQEDLDRFAANAAYDGDYRAQVLLAEIAALRAKLAEAEKRATDAEKDAREIAKAVAPAGAASCPLCGPRDFHDQGCIVGRWDTVS